MKRRNWIKTSGYFAIGGAVLGHTACASSQYKKSDNDMFFNISLAEWSLHRALWGKELDHLDFATKASSLGINAVEYVNQFFADKAEDLNYLDQMNKAAKEANVKQLLIMIDREGNLGDPNDTNRNEAVENHHKWVHAAKYLGCHSIRVNAFGIGSAADVKAAAVQGLGTLSEYAAKENINVIVENHGSYSSDGRWLSDVMSQVNMPNCGTLPDFGNFCMEREGGVQWGAPCVKEYDKYKGVEEMMSYAKAVSAKANVFNAMGEEREIDFEKMLTIVKKYGYNGYVGIEYEGNELTEEEGILATKALLEKYGRKLS